MARNLLILTAVHLEAQAIQKRMPGRQGSILPIGIGGGHLPLPAELGGYSTILLCGLGGGLDPALGVGDVVVDDANGRLTGSGKFRMGRIHTAKKIISSPEQKAELFERTAAAVVDMEQSIVREFAREHGIDVIGIRSISDTADQVLDPAVVQLVDEMGRPRPMRIAGQLLRRPSLIRYLRTLNKNTNIALQSLTQAVQSIASQLEGK